VASGDGVTLADIYEPCAVSDLLPGFGERVAGDVRGIEEGVPMGVPAFWGPGEFKPGEAAGDV